jgi:raffinose/stachyose/melibiose transport system permease protein
LSRTWLTAGFDGYFPNTVIYSVSSTLVELTKSAMLGRMGPTSSRPSG